MLKVIPKNHPVLITSGAYSNYSINAVFEATCDIAWEELRDEYLAIHPEQKKDYEFCQESFVNWLVNEKSVLREITAFEWHTSEYHCVERMEVSQISNDYSDD